jgi:hypothetical protein
VMELWLLSMLGFREESQISIPRPGIANPRCETIKVLACPRTFLTQNLLANGTRRGNEPRVSLRRYPEQTLANFNDNAGVRQERCFRVPLTE